MITFIVPIRQRECTVMRTADAGVRHVTYVGTFLGATRVAYVADTHHWLHRYISSIDYWYSTISSIEGEDLW